MRDLVCARGGKLLLAFAGDALLLVDLASASVRALDPPPQPTTVTTTTTEQQEQPQQKKKRGATPPPLQVEGLGQIEAVALSDDGAVAAAVYRHKVLALWSTPTGSLLAQRVLPKKALALQFGAIKGQRVLLVHDKVGDVRAYPADAQLGTRSTLLLGHTASVGTCLALSPNGARLASGDRDEKVRVSRFPCTLVVEGYLTGHDNFVSAVRFLPDGSQLLTASGDGTLGLWDARGCASLGVGAVDPTAAAAAAAAQVGQGKEEEQGKEQGEGTTTASVVPLALAVAPDGTAAVATVLGRSELRVFALPSLTVQQTLPTPSPALGVDACAAPPLPQGGGGDGTGSDSDLLFATVAAPEYLLVFQRQPASGGYELVPDHPVAAAVKAFASERGVGTEIVHAAEDEGLLGGMTKENLTTRHAWNDRKRKEESKERQRERDKRRRAGGKGGRGSEGEGSAGEEEAAEAEAGVAAMEA